MVCGCGVGCSALAQQCCKTNVINHKLFTRQNVVGPEKRIANLRSYSMKAMIERQRFSPLMQLALLLVIMGTGIFLGSLVSELIKKAWMLLQPSAGVRLADLKNNVQFLRVLQVAGTFFAFILPAYVFTWLVYGKPSGRNLGFSTVISGKQMFLVVLMFIASLFVSGSLELITQKIPLPKNLETTFRHWEDEYDKGANALAIMRSNAEYAMALFILALLPAIAEEMVFRACLQKVMINITRNATAGIIIASILFSLMHGSYYGFFVRVFLGCLLGYIYYYGKNIWLNIALHFLNNAFIVTEMYSVARNGGISPDTSAGKNIPLFSFVFMGMAALFGIVYLFRMYKMESEYVISMHRLDDIDENEQ